MKEVFLLIKMLKGLVINSQGSHVPCTVWNYSSVYYKVKTLLSSLYGPFYLCDLLPCS